MFRTFTNNKNNKTCERTVARAIGTIMQNAEFTKLHPHLDRKAFERLKLVAQW